MIIRRSPLAAGALAAVLIAPAAGAVTLTTEAEYLVGGVSTLLDSDTAPSGTVGSAVITSDPFAVSTDFSTDAYARALNVDGVTAVDANGLFAHGSTVPPGTRFELRSEAVFADTVVNTTGATQDYFYDFTVFGPVLELADFAGASVGANGINARYDIQIRVDGSAVWSSSALLNGGNVSHVLTETGTDLGGTFFTSLGNFGYLFDDLTTSVALATVANGGSFLFEAVVAVSIDALPFELGARARIGDPGAVGGGQPGVSGTIVTGTATVPAPATLALFAAGLVGASRIRRRRAH